MSLSPCCNLSGTDKRKPLMIGVSKSPRPFKNFKAKKYIEYSNNKKARMASEVFNAYFFRLGQKSDKGGRKICLFVDSCSAHKINVKFKKIEIQFIPPNTTSLLQPLGGGIIKSFKSHFTASKLNDIFDAVEQGHDAQSAFKQIDLRNAVIYKNLARGNISASAIRNCYSPWK